MWARKALLMNSHSDLNPSGQGKQTISALIFIRKKQSFFLIVCELTKEVRTLSGQDFAVMSFEVERETFEFDLRFVVP
jgi:hypothetical protein